MKNYYSALLGRPAKVALVALILGGLGLAMPSYAQETQTYYCSPTETLLIKMMAGPAIEVTLPDGRTMVLPQAESASGTKYSNGSLTVWSKGNTALVEEGGTVKWQDCVKI
ncbi:MliC family protein [Synechocystis sp. FACHB-383]|uniref:MliC family protein n=1 Tax=Synechocystis sp. FACHB-383 TaxID=2692864 RepID=UPI001685E50A|nr:MliC family protein [Synechocystis sp. FACHB-383]MBD2653359.1 MliC family protein [Synechocystis sp. FACHB-383]